MADGITTDEDLLNNKGNRFYVLQVLPEEGDWWISTSGEEGALTLKIPPQSKQCPEQIAIQTDSQYKAKN
jgi:hypothetical protein